MKYYFFNSSKTTGIYDLINVRNKIKIVTLELKKMVNGDGHDGS